MLENATYKKKNNPQNNLKNENKMQNHMKNPQSMCSISFVSGPACPRNVLSYTSHNSRIFGCKMGHLVLYPFECLSSSLQFTFLLFLAPTAYLLHKTDYGCPVIAA